MEICWLQQNQGLWTDPNLESALLAPEELPLSTKGGEGPGQTLGLTRAGPGELEGGLSPQGALQQGGVDLMILEPPGVCRRKAIRLASGCKAYASYKQLPQCWRRRQVSGEL